MKTPSTSGIQLKLLFVFFFKWQKRNSRHHRTQVCLSPLLGPTLNSWDILDLEITPFIHHTRECCHQFQLKIIEKTEFLYAFFRLLFEQSLKTLLCLSSNTASPISVLDIAPLRPLKCTRLLTQRTHRLIAAKDIPVIVIEEMRENFVLHHVESKAQQWLHPFPWKY